MYLFQWYPITNIQIQISINPVCDRPTYLTASDDEPLACIKQTSLHTTTSLMGPILGTAAHNRIIVDSLLTYTARPLSFLFHFIFHTTTEHYLRLPCIHLHTFCFQLDFHWNRIISRRLSSPSAIKIKSSACINSRGKPVYSSVVIISITLTK